MRADPGKPKVIKVRAHTRTVKPRKQADPGAVAAGQRMAAQGTAIAQQTYKAKTTTQRAASRAAARAAGSNKTRTQRDFLATSGKWNSPAGQGRGALARVYSNPRAAAALAAAHQGSKPKTKSESIIATKIKTDAKQAAATRATLKGVKAPFFDAPARSTVGFTMTQLQRPSAAIAAAVKQRVTNPAGLPGHGGDGAWQAFKHPKEHARDWNDTFEAAGVHNKAVNSGLALAANIATDPTTYVAFGTTTAAKEAGLRAMRSALKDAPHDVEAAVRAGRKAAAATGEAGQRKGVQVGVRGIPARAMGKRVVMSKPLGAKTKQALVDAGRKTGATHVGGEVARSAREAMRRAVANPNVKPSPAGYHWDDFEWEAAKMAGNTARAGERQAQHQANIAQHAVHKATKNWSEDQHLKVLTALEHNNPASLSADERKVYDHVDRLRGMWAKREGRSLKGRVGVGEAPTPPAIPHPITSDDIAGSRSKVKAAVAEHRRQVKTYEDSLRGAGVVHGRAQGLSESVGGTAARKAAQAKDPSFVAGQHGVDIAEGHLAAGKANVEASREAVRDATRAHALLKQQAGLERQSVRNFIKQQRTFSEAPEGYAMRRLKPPDSAGKSPSWRTGARNVGTSTSYKARHLTKSLDQMTPEELSQFETNIPKLVGARSLEHGRNQTLAERNRWAAGMGDVVKMNADQARDLNGATGQRLFARDEHGNLKPLWNGDTDKFDAAKAITHINKGHDIIKVDPYKMATLDRLATGGRVKPLPAPEDLLRPEPGEQTENFLARTHRTWKWWATAPNPSYHLRNVVGDTFNALVAGTQVGDLRRGFQMSRADTAFRAIEKSLDSPEGRHALETLRKAAQRTDYYPAVGTLSDLEVMGLANKLGVSNAGLVSGELREMQLAGEGPVVSALHLAPARDTIQKVGDFRENIARIATFRNGLKRGMSPHEAAAYSLKHHIDYANLSQAEHQAWRYIFPFWTWWSRNLPLQVGGVLKNPGLYANTEKARQQSLIAAGQDPNVEQGMSPSDEENLPWGTPLHQKGVPVVAAPGLSYSDLGSVPLPHSGMLNTTQPVAQDLLGRANPFVKTAVEAGAGLNLYTMKPFVDNNQGAWVPAPGWMPKDAPGVQMKFDKKSGKMVPMVRFQEQGALNLLPVAQRLGKVSSAQPDPSKPGAGLSALSWLTGPSYKPAEPHALALTKLYSQRAKVDDWITEHQGDYKHKTGEKWTGPVGQAYKKKAKIQKQIDAMKKALGYQNVRSAGRPAGSGGSKFSGGGSGAFGSGSFGG